MKSSVLLIAILLFGLIALFGCTTENKDTNVVACPMDARMCSDGSSVGRVGPNCEFAPCQNSGADNNVVVCTMEVKMCSDGIAVSRVAPDCEFAPCQNSGSQLANPASVNCIDHNGTLEIINTNEGQIGICTLPDGKECEEWSYLRGNC